MIDSILDNHRHPIREPVEEPLRERRVVAPQNPLRLRTALEASFQALCPQAEVVSDVAVQNWKLKMSDVVNEQTKEEDTQRHILITLHHPSDD